MESHVKDGSKTASPWDVLWPTGSNSRIVKGRRKKEEERIVQ